MIIIKAHVWIRTFMLYLYNNYNILQTFLTNAIIFFQGESLLRQQGRRPLLREARPPPGLRGLRARAVRPRADRRLQRELALQVRS